MVQRLITSLQRECVLRSLFIPLFPKLTMVDLAFMPGFSSVVGSVPSGDGSSEACDGVDLSEAGKSFIVDINQCLFI